MGIRAMFLKDNMLHENGQKARDQNLNLLPDLGCSGQRLKEERIVEGDYYHNQETLGKRTDTLG